jgi:cell division septum initiation protein DivIVA
MSRPLRVLVFILLLVLCPPAAAAADQADDVKQLIDEAAVLSQEIDALTAQIADEWTKVGKIDPAGKHAADALPLLKQLKADYAEVAKKAQSKAALLDEAAALDGGEEAKTFAGLMKEVADGWTRYAAFETDGIGKLEILFDSSRVAKLSQADARKLIRELDTYGTREAKLQSQLGEQQLAAQQYFTEHGFGVTEPAVGETTTVATQSRAILLGASIGGLIVAIVVAVVCGLLARRKGRSVAGWSILGFFFPLIGLILILVLSEKKPAQPSISATPPSDAPPPAAPHPAA